MKWPQCKKLSAVGAREPREKFFLFLLTLTLSLRRGEGKRNPLLAKAKPPPGPFGRGPGPGNLPYFSLSVNVPDKEARAGGAAREAAINLKDKEGER